MEYLREFDEADGKTVATARRDVDYALITFTDGTGLLIHAENGYDGCDADIECERYPPSELRTQQQIGLITEAEYEALMAARIKDSERLHELAERKKLRELVEKYGAPK